jgi:SAM-dependent methyltransferase
MSASYFRYLMRRLAYSRAVYPLLTWARGTFPSADSNADPQVWDRDLRNRFKSYLEPTIPVLAHAHIIAALARCLVPGGRSALDLGCGAGYQAEILHSLGYTRYVGIDIGQAAVERACELMHVRREHYPPECCFERRDIAGMPNRTIKGPFDIIIFSEVLYYVGNPVQAAQTVIRFSTVLAEGGAFAIAMKDDAKSHAILRELSVGHNVVRSLLFQEQMDYPRFRLTVSRERPAYLISILRPNTRGASLVPMAADSLHVTDQ